MSRNVLCRSCKERLSIAESQFYREVCCPYCRQTFVAEEEDLLPVAPASQAPRNATLGNALRVLAVVLLLLPLGYLVLVRGLSGRSPGGCDYALAAATQGLALWLWRLGKKLAAKRAEEYLQADPRPPILLLRSFADDEFLFERGSGPIMVVPKMEVSLEEVLATVYGAQGPVVAIGRPGERLPPPGFGRTWVSDEEWKGKVANCLDECQKAVLILGSTSGLTWEIDQLFEKNVPEKVVLVLPPLGEAAARSRWETARSLFRGILPGYQGGEVAVTFDANWGCAVARVEPGLWGSFGRTPEDYRRILEATSRRPPASPGLVGQTCVFCQRRIEAAQEGAFCRSCGAPSHGACVQKPDATEGLVNCQECGAVPGLRYLPQAKAGEARSGD
jgi:hypothetical protein